jgi:hypothetical protein
LWLCFKLQGDVDTVKPILKVGELLKTCAMVCVVREQPIFTTKAHVFQIDPETKKNWLPASKTAVSVSYYYDSTRNTYRIISVDGSKVRDPFTVKPVK